MLYMFILISLSCFKALQNKKLSQHAILFWFWPQGICIIKVADQLEHKYGTEVFLLWSYRIIRISLAAVGLCLKEMSFITIAKVQNFMPWD